MHKENGLMGHITTEHTNWGEEFVEYELSRRQELLDQEDFEWHAQYIDFLEGKRDAYLDELEDVQ